MGYLRILSKCPLTLKNDRFLQRICDVSTKLTLALGTKGLVNIQYLIYEDELYVIEVNPRASRTIPYISKVTNVPMVDLASRIMLGTTLSELGYGTGLWRTPPYYAVKVYPTTFGSAGGVTTTEEGRVTTQDGTVIPGLYAAGEMSNRYFYNENYILAASLGLYSTMGRRAGAAAAQDALAK